MQNVSICDCVCFFLYLGPGFSLGGQIRGFHLYCLRPLFYKAQIIKLSNTQIIKLSNYQIIKLSNHQITKLSNYPIIHQRHKEFDSLIHFFQE